jgi:hypothetical protein
MSNAVKRKLMLCVERLLRRRWTPSRAGLSLLFRFSVGVAGQRQRLMLLSLLILSMPAAANDASWHLELDRDDVQVYMRPVEGWSIREIRGITRIPSRLSSVVAVINDPRAQGKLEERVTQAEIQHRESETRYQLHARLRMPWPVSDRDIVNLRTIVQDPVSLAVTITDTALANAPPQPGKGVIRIEKSTQTWSLVPHGTDEVIAQVTLLSDPNGSMPATLINSMSITTPYKMLRALNALAKESPYSTAQLAFVRDK